MVLAFNNTFNLSMDADMNEQLLSYKIAKHLLDGDREYLEGLNDAIDYLQSEGNGLKGLRQIVDNSNHIKGDSDES